MSLFVRFMCFQIAFLNLKFQVNALSLSKSLSTAPSNTGNGSCAESPAASSSQANAPAAEEVSESVRLKNIPITVRLGASGKATTVMIDSLVVPKIWSGYDMGWENYS